MMTLFLADVSFTCGQGGRVNETNSAFGCCQLPNRITCDAGYTDRSRASEHGPVQQLVRPESLSCHFAVRLRARRQMRAWCHQATLLSASPSVSIVKRKESDCSDGSLDGRGTVDA